MQSRFGPVVVVVAMLVEAGAPNARTVRVGVEATAAAQYGHPLKGTWSGDWGPNATTRDRVLLEMDWDGRTISGAINPGPNAAPFSKAELNPANWTVHIEATGKDGSGRAVRYVLDGKIENLGAFRRRITGTWVQGSSKGTFVITRN